MTHPTALLVVRSKVKGVQLGFGEIVSPSDIALQPRFSKSRKRLD